MKENIKRDKGLRADGKWKPEIKEEKQQEDQQDIDDDGNAEIDTIGLELSDLLFSDLFLHAQESIHPT